MPYSSDERFCIEPPDVDAPLWRLMDLGKFEWLLTKRALYFRRADAFEDALEGTLPTANDELGRFFGNPYDRETEKGREFTGHKRRIWSQARRWWYVNCWHSGAEPTERMWERYGDGGRGVAVRSSFARLALALQRTRRRVLISGVEYLDGHERPVSERILTAALVRKVRQYSDESEVRAMTHLSPLGPRANFWDNPRSAGLAVPVRVDHLVSAVIFGPATSEADRLNMLLLMPLGGLVVQAVE